ncbi:hypothetical protein AHMF7605_07800 [Adhaeribacter arboris]|uniref:Uncharacterized protein n=1 Tax=Adhaeribacter arboris TaxID=2072846 RepID=A0A2T2YD74_9BACT|nr:hypothetical protein AHMF7605_07800 [Adhaeribacter arboris]
MDIDRKEVIYGSYAAIKQFQTQGYGTLINLGSIEIENPLSLYNLCASVPRNEQRKFRNFLQANTNYSIA